jgi:hypothetical protein
VKIKNLNNRGFGKLRALVNTVRGEPMDHFYTPFVHTLLFSCKSCNRPLAISVLSARRNLEEIDADTFEVGCECGWRKESLGIEATRHWVNECEDKVTIENSGERREANR